MKYRRFGKTELKMPVLTCGGMRFQQAWKDLPASEVTPENQENLEKVVRRAIELGINHFETARGYGSSEIQLGKALKKFPREEIILQSKVAPSANPAEFEKNLKTTFKRLDIEYLDLFAIHGISNNREWYENGLRCLPVAEKFQKEGRIRCIGFSGHGKNEFKLAAIKTGAFSFINMHYYYVQQAEFESVVVAGAYDMGILIISPNDKGGHLHTPTEKMRGLTAPLTPMQFNDLFCLVRPEVHTLSIGAKAPEDFDEHVKAVEQIDRAREIALPIAGKLDAEIEKVFGEGWLNNYRKGLSGYEKNFNKINIRDILRLYTYAKGLDMVEYGKARYKLMSPDCPWVPGSKAENFTGADLADNLKDSPFAGRIPDMLREAHQMLKPTEQE